MRISYASVVACSITFLFILSFLPTQADAQHRFDRWYFGLNAGIDFSQGAPTAVLDGQLSTLEGCATISDDATGDLLFYTDGVTVWDNTHTVMPNGQDLKGHWTSSQSALIVPTPGDPLRYFIFTSGAGFYHTANDPNNGVRYSIVDLSLNGGKGDVTSKNIELIGRGDATEMLSATKHCNGIDYWVVAHELENSRFHAYLIDGSGIADTVSTDIGSVRSGDLGTQSMARFSPNGKMLVVATPGDRSLELFEFDNESGNLSNYQAIGTDYYYYGPEFSPDNTKLYSSTLALSTENDFLYQFDLNAGSLTAIQQSRTILHTESGRWDGAQCQLGPDGKIYVSFISRQVLGVIENPNATGAAASYDHSGLDLGGRGTQYGLPNTISADFTTPQGNDSALVVTLESDLDSMSAGETITVRLIICNISGQPVNNIDVKATLPPELAQTSGGTFPKSIATLGPLDCDTITISLLLGQAPPTATTYTVCSDILSIPTSACDLPSTASDCLDIVGKAAPPDTSAVDYTFYTTGGCPGTSAFFNLPFNSRRYTDTINSIAFTGPDGRFFEYAGDLPINFPIRPTRDQNIPLRVQYQHSGEMSTVAELRTTFGDLFRVRIIARVKPASTPLFDVTEVHMGQQQSGVRDTCITVRNVHSLAVKITDSLWFHGSTRRARITSPNIPVVVAPGEAIDLCVQISGDGEIRDTLMLGGAENVSFCPHCVAHTIVFDNLSGRPVSGIAFAGIGMSSAEVTLVVSPNPVTTQASLSLEVRESGEYQLSLYSTLGKIVESFSSRHFEPGSHVLVLDTSTLPSGQYWAEIVGAGERIRSQVIVR